MRFEIFKATDGEFYFHLKGGNGEKIAQSEGYTRKESAQETIAAIKKGAAMAEVVDNA